MMVSVAPATETLSDALSPPREGFFFCLSQRQNGGPARGY
uniref:Uncharacterized protein n=1 Tax=Cupriavidus taiwanensis TaxID=164546 RepID=A0A375HG19_9BURK|nr:protein of unknown function [Cupriavidus taiwanensis]